MSDKLHPACRLHCVLFNPIDKLKTYRTYLSHTFTRSWGKLPRLVYANTSSIPAPDCADRPDWRFPVFSGGVPVSTARAGARNLEPFHFSKPDLTTSADNPLGLGATGEAGFYRLTKTWRGLSREDDLSAR